MAASRGAFRLRIVLLVGVAASSGAAGIAGAQGRTVTYAADAKPRDNWTLEALPAVEIGGEGREGPTDLVEIMGVVRLSSGRIAVANAATTEVRVFSPRGVFERTLGRKGQGPGEFNFVWDLFAAADTILATDNTGRANVFSSSGRLLRTLPRPRVPDVQRAMPIALMRDGSSVLSGFGPVAEMRTGERVAFLQVTRESANGGPQEAIASFPGYRQVASPGGPRAVERYQPVARVVARNNVVCGGYPAAYRIQCVSRIGHTLMDVIRDVPRRRIAEEDRQFLRDAFVNANDRHGDPTRTARLRAETTEYRFAEFAPAYSRLLLSAEGELWVSEFDRTEGSLGTRAFVVPKDQLRYSVFDLEGVWLSDVVLPARFTPHDVGRDYVLGVTVDEDELERVTMWRVRR